MSTKVSGIYQVIRTDTSECYIGHSTDIQRRFSTHAANMKKGKFKYYNTFNEGWKLNQIKFEILEEGLSEEELQEREDWWIYYLTKADFIVANKNKAGKPQKNNDEVRLHKSLAQTGEKNGNNKYCAELIRYIKVKINEGLSNKAISDILGVDNGYISQIRTNRVWNSIQV